MPPFNAVYEVTFFLHFYLKMRAAKMFDSFVHFTTIVTNRNNFLALFALNLALISANRANISGDLAVISGPFAVYALISNIRADQRL